MTLPQDIANLLAVAIRDVLWFKNSVRSFLIDCGVDASILQELPRKTPTITLTQHVLSRLNAYGSKGDAIARTMLTKMYYWKDLHTVPPDRKDAAVASLKALQDAYKLYEAQRQHQEEQERKMHSERVDRVSMSALDHERLQAFRVEFDAIHAEQNPQTRGDRFEDLMNKVFEYYSDDSKGAFRRTGEQIDGLFYFDKHWYYVEIRWKEEKAKAADISVLRDRAKSAYGGDTKAVFISFNGYSQECLDSLKGNSDERVVLMDGYDLRCVLDCQIALDVLLAAKQADIVQNRRPFISTTEILAKRAK